MKIQPLIAIVVVAGISVGFYLLLSDKSAVPSSDPDNTANPGQPMSPQPFDQDPIRSSDNISLPSERTDSAYAAPLNPRSAQDCFRAATEQETEDCLIKYLSDHYDPNLLIGCFRNDWPGDLQYLSDEQKRLLLKVGLIVAPAADATRALLGMVEVSATDKEAMKLGMPAFEEAMGRMELQGVEQLLLDRFHSGGEEPIYLMQVMMSSDRVRQALEASALSTLEPTARRAAALAAYCTRSSGSEAADAARISLLSSALSPVNLLTEPLGSTYIEYALSLAASDLVISPEGPMLSRFSDALNSREHREIAVRILREAMGSNKLADQQIEKLLR